MTVEHASAKPFKVAVSSASFAKSPVLMAELAALGVTVVANTTGTVLEELALKALLREANPDVVIIGTEVVNARVLDACPRVKLIAKYGVGLDNVDEAELVRRGIKLGWTPGVNKRGVAELALTFALGHFRNVFVSVQRMKAGRWVKDGGEELSGKTVGIVGLGETGSEFAKLVRGLGCPVVYCDVVDKSAVAREVGAREVGFEELLREADVVSFHVPLTEATRGMLGEVQLHSMRISALVINTSRGSIVNFEAACKAVTRKLLGGFAADVFPVEPCDLTQWAGGEGLYFTPHIAGNSVEAVLAMGRSAVKRVEEFLRG